MGLAADLPDTSAGIRRAHSSFRGKACHNRRGSGFADRRPRSSCSRRSQGARSRRPERRRRAISSSSHPTARPSRARSRTTTCTSAAARPSDLAGDTSISAADVYIASGAHLDTCFMPPSSNGGCTAGRSLTIGSTRPDQHRQRDRPRGRQRHRAARRQPRAAGRRRQRSRRHRHRRARVAAARARSRSPRPGPVSLSSGRTTRRRSTRPGAPVSIHGTTVSLSGDVDTLRAATRTSRAPARSTSRRRAGRSSVYGNVNAAGRDGSAATARRVTLRGTDVRVGQIDASAGSSSAGAPGLPAPVDAAGTTSLSISGLGRHARLERPLHLRRDRRRQHPPRERRTGRWPGRSTRPGANADSAPPSGGGSIVISGAGVATGQLFTNGGSRSHLGRPRRERQQRRDQLDRRGLDR